MAMFATLAQSKLTSWEQIAAANGHNARTIEVPNARADGHPPIEVVDRPGANLTERMRNRLEEAGVTKIRKNAVLAFEDIFGASPSYWAKQFPGGWQNASVEELMADPLVRAVEEFARKKHGDNLVSITWHLDEKSPHAHVVAIPLVTREHKQRGRKRKDGTVPAPVMKTTLAAEQLRGGSKYTLEQQHDEWAAFVVHLGLVRGRRGSELSPEDQRDRRLRDPQASLEGEKRAAERQAEIEMAARVMIELQNRGQKDRDEGQSQAAAMIAKAQAEADRIRERTETDVKLREAELDRRERAFAQKSAVEAARAAAKALALANREAALAKRESVLEQLLAEFEPVLATVRNTFDRIRSAPAEIRRWLDPTATAEKQVQAASPLLEQARAAVENRPAAPMQAKGPAKPAASDPVAAMAALKGVMKGPGR